MSRNKYVVAHTPRTKFRIGVFALATMLLIGCGAGYMAGSDIERSAFTTFQPIGSGQFRFMARTYFDGDAANKRASKDSGQEKVRIAWLEKYLALNSRCPNGYDIEDRTVSLRINDPYTQHEIFYSVRCR